MRRALEVLGKQTPVGFTRGSRAAGARKTQADACSSGTQGRAQKRTGAAGIIMGVPSGPMTIWYPAMAGCTGMGNIASGPASHGRLDSRD